MGAMAGMAGLGQNPLIPNAINPLIPNFYGFGGMPGAGAGLIPGLSPNLLGQMAMMQQVHLQKCLYCVIIWCRFKRPPRWQVDLQEREKGMSLLMMKSWRRGRSVHRGKIVYQIIIDHIFQVLNGQGCIKGHFMSSNSVQ